MGPRLDGIRKILAEFAPGPVHWTANDVPDMSGKVVLVTGGNSGVGYTVAEGLLKKNATVYIGARSVPKAEAAIKALEESTGSKNVHLLQMDLSDLGSVKSAAEEFLRKEKALHVLINNAGVMSPPMEQLTTQNYDLQFGTNVLGHYLLSTLLLPLLITTSSSLPPTDPVRIVEVTSDAIFVSQGVGKDLILYETLVPGKQRDGMGGSPLYAQSKTGNLLVAKARARSLKGKNVVSIAVNPGRIASDLNRNFPSYVRWLFNTFLIYPAEMGSINELWAATSPEAIDHSGAWVTSWARVKEPRIDQIDNVEAEDKLIDWLEEQLRSHHVLPE